jgi:hypothetical protein
MLDIIAIQKNELKEKRIRNICRRYASRVGTSICNAIASSANLNKIGEEPFPLPKDKEQCYDSQFDPAEPLGELTQEDALPDHSPQPHQVISVFLLGDICCNFHVLYTCILNPTKHVHMPPLGLLNASYICFSMHVILYYSSFYSICISSYMGLL